MLTALNRHPSLELSKHAGRPGSTDTGVIVADTSRRTTHGQLISVTLSLLRSRTARVASCGSRDGSVRTDVVVLKRVSVDITAATTHVTG